jgi:hypothetical protein
MESLDLRQPGATWMVVFGKTWTAWMCGDGDGTTDEGRTRILVIPPLAQVGIAEAH